MSSRSYEYRPAPSPDVRSRPRPRFERRRHDDETRELATPEIEDDDDAQSDVDAEWRRQSAYDRNYSSHGYPREDHSSYRTERPYETLRVPSPANASAKRRDRADEVYKDPTGLTVLHEPEGTPISDLVFVHGLGGGSVRTWSADARPGSYWPLDWLAKEPLIASTRISTYGYNSHATATDPDRLLDLAELAKDLLTKLRFGLGREGRSLNVGCVPLIFVSHSLGGLIAKKAYLLAMSDSNFTYGEIGRATSAFVFFSTPHRGLHQTSIINDILLACVAGWRSTQNGEVVKRHTPKLTEINEKFRDLAAPLDIYSFYARPSANTDPGYDVLALPSHSTTLDHPSETPIPLDADHTTMTKYRSRHDPNYTSVRGALRVLVEKFQSRRKSPAPEDATLQAAEVFELLQGREAPQDDLAFFADKRIEGSCSWTLDQPVMEAFLESPDLTPHVLWCFGGPGSGKSVTATYLIEHLLDEQRPCAYYYFRSGDQVKNSLGQFLISVASQLSQQIPQYRRKMTALAADRFDTGKAGHKLLWKKLFISALLQCSLDQAVFIVIDGLDELPHAKELLQKMLTELNDSRARLRLLLVGRATVEIETSIERLSKRMQVQRLALDHNADDLALYVRDEMDTMMGGDDFRERIVKQVLAKADRNFLWAHLVVREILECQTEVQVESALLQVPEELEALYENMDKRIADMLRSRPQDQAMGHTIIKWAACARRPLHLDEIEAALESEFPRIMDMRQTVQRLCGEFVHVDKKGHVSMMHASARETLMTNSSMHYYINPHQTNHALYTRCVQALTVDPRLHARHSTSAEAFLAYAASSWPYHLTVLTQNSDFGAHTAMGVALMFLSSSAVLNWMSAVAATSDLRVMVEASRALGRLLKVLDRLDQDASPLTHRLEDKETIGLWSQDLIRVVGKFGAQIVKQPNTVFDLLPAFCPKDSILHNQFRSTQVSRSKSSNLLVRGRLNPTWDDCFAKFAVPGEALPHSIMSLDRYFAILTKGDGVVHLYYSLTCELARRLMHRETVLAWCADSSITRIATYGFKKTMVWDIESSRLLASVENPTRSKALAMSFQRSPRGDDLLMTLSDDRTVRSCTLDAMRVEWALFGSSLGDEMGRVEQVNSPHNAQFSADGLQLAVSYRGANPSVWDMGAKVPRFVAHCDHRARRGSKMTYQHTRLLYVQDFAWNTLTGHLLGIYNDGLIFKWHPSEDDFVLCESEFKSESIKCSTDGKLFVTSTGSGTLRIWDFEHFTPIYEMRYPIRIQDLDLGWNEARIYDVREQYCNIWEPGSLLRAMESDDISSDTQSSKDSVRPSLAPDAQRDQETFEPVTAFTVMDEMPIYACGNDAGLVSVVDFDGNPLLELEESYMSIERIAWCNASSMLANVDLGREIKVRQLKLDRDQRQIQGTPKIVSSFSETDEVSQILFKTAGDKLMVVTTTHVKVWNIATLAQPTVLPVVRPSKWIPHPLNNAYVLGFGANQVVLLAWNNLMSSSVLAYESVEHDAEHYDRSSARLPNPRRPSQAYPASPSEIDHTVEKVLFSPSCALALVEVYGATKQTRRRSDVLLIETKHLIYGGTANTVPVFSLPAKLLDTLHVSLGFITPISRTPSTSDHRRCVPHRQHDFSTFAFVDKDFWVCSADVWFGQGEDVEISRYFFLPRDWQNAEWLDMATVTKGGDFLCPRNGDVAVVSNGFADEFRPQNS
ncbi:unnamed protein product [Zymoseptoria tritici ST99CH_1A5]|uniref:Uncharacterized protein n=1 Tax=Zymoseptoria tritici ST99CH_1A5 TaxID=1276529 RepID=A0A1Y6L9R0_ZYMTR|nr:unnamed protein product [Zymoseptoria tritici ST99CH_1A5]